MKNTLFDKHVKEQLGSIKPDVPAHIWENIVAEQSKKRPVGIWGWFTALNIAAAVAFLLAAGGLTYYFVHNPNSTGTPSANDQPVAVKNNAAGNNNNNQASDNTDQSSTASANENNSGQDNTNNTSGSVTNPLNTPSNLSINSAQGIADHNNNKQNNFSGTHRKYNSNANLLVNTSNGVTEKNEFPFATNDNSGYNEKYLTGGFLYADLLKTNNQFDPKLKMPLLGRVKDVPCPKAEREAAGNKTYVEVYGGPDLVIRNITAYNNGAFEQQRRESAHTMVSYSAGIRYTKVFGSGMSVRTGLNYSQINESFSQVKGHVTQNVYITNDRGDTTGTYTVSGTQYKKNTNKYRSIDIPVMAGYEFGNGRLHTNVNAGAMINIHSSQSGYVVDPNGNAVDIKKAGVYSFKANTGVSLAGAVSVYYKLNEKLHIMAEPYFRYSLSPVTQNELPLKQKYHTAGLRLGLRLDL